LSLAINTESNIDSYGVKIEHQKERKKERKKRKKERTTGRHT
jgi:hypothetical protein